MNTNVCYLGGCGSKNLRTTDIMYRTEEILKKTMLIRKSSTLKLVEKSKVIPLSCSSSMHVVFRVQDKKSTVYLCECVYIKTVKEDDPTHWLLFF